jgi:hypothetical protein
MLCPVSILGEASPFGNAERSSVLSRTWYHVSQRRTGHSVLCPYETISLATAYNVIRAVTTL